MALLGVEDLLLEDWKKQSSSNTPYTTGGGQFCMIVSAFA